MNKTAIALIKKHEGFEDHLYKCTAGHWTIGYGYNLDANPLHLSEEGLSELRHNGITETRAAKFVKWMLESIERDLSANLIWYFSINSARQAVLLDMAYNLGVPGILKFKNTLALIGQKKYTEAAQEMLDSTWARQVPNRARELAEIMRTGSLS